MEDKFITELLKKASNKAESRSVWGVDLATTWVPFFVATNTEKKTNIDPSVLGSPLRLATNTDGSVKFAKSGKPVFRVDKQLTDMVKGVKDNFVAGIQSYTSNVYQSNEAGYNATVKTAVEAGNRIKAVDQGKLTDAIAKRNAIIKAETDRLEADRVKSQIISDAMKKADNVEAGKVEADKIEAGKVEAGKVKVKA